MDVVFIFCAKLWLSSSPVLVEDEFCASLKSRLESCQGQDEILHNAGSYLEFGSQSLWGNCA